jgi:hypothetical protein
MGLTAELLLKEKVDDLFRAKRSDLTTQTKSPFREIKAGGFLVFCLWFVEVDHSGTQALDDDFKLLVWTCCLLLSHKSSDAIWMTKRISELGL